MIYWILWLVFVALWVIGGKISGRLRDIPCPIILGVAIGLLTKNVWIGLMITGLTQTIRLGYGNYEPGEKNCFLACLLQDTNGKWIRAVWGLIVSVAIGAGLSVVGLLPLKIFGGYVLLNTAINFYVSDFKLNWIQTDILVSTAIYSIVMLLGVELSVL